MARHSVAKTQLIAAKGLVCMSSAAAYSEPTIAGALRNTTKPHFTMPSGATDCHAHIFGPQSRYAYDPKRRYTPPDALIGDYVGMLTTLGVQRAVLVQPSVYMADNTALLDGLAEASIPMRGIAVVGADVTDAELERLHAAGVRGLRLNLRFENGAGADIAPTLARRVAPLGWHLQFRIMSENYAGVLRMLDDLAVDIVVDHIGQVPAEQGVGGKDFQALLGLVRTGRVWVKLSAPMRMSLQPMPHPDVTPFVRELVASAPGQMLWATDWPHTTITTPMPNDGALADLLLDWIPDEATRRRVLVDNPAARYGF
jgi:2-pyrone-4,6-dicarboxylate lactonase